MLSAEKKKKKKRYTVKSQSWLEKKGWFPYKPKWQHFEGGHQGSLAALIRDMKTVVYPESQP